MLDWLLLVVLVVLPMRTIRDLLFLGFSVGVERYGKVRGGRRARHLFDRKDRVHRNRSILSITSIFHFQFFLRLCFFLVDIWSASRVDTLQGFLDAFSLLIKEKNSFLTLPEEDALVMSS